MAALSFLSRKWLSVAVALAGMVFSQAKSKLCKDRRGLLVFTPYAKAELEIIHEETIRFNITQHEGKKAQYTKLLLALDAEILCVATTVQGQQKTIDRIELGIFYLRSEVLALKKEIDVLQQELDRRASL